MNVDLPLARAAGETSTTHNELSVAGAVSVLAPSSVRTSMKIDHGEPAEAHLPEASGETE
ncbi:hypothetical protein [Streptomyces sp. NBC_00258]|uniref:hypothetical protein n=1 Tax=Streptomyces sp. NBC_00258 TaxID=2903642 RepID=UPI002E2843CD|nr:hypothetical protein [Streptomyces sp. NBC_00258]